MTPKRQIDYLYELSEQRGSEGREELYLCVADLFSREGHHISPSERQQMKDILMRLTHEVEMAVRRGLAERLADNKSIPEDLILLLADDRIEVARPILMRSEVLKNADLIEIIRHKSQGHRVAIAARERVHEDVSDALVESGDKDAILALLDNPGAQIRSGTLRHLVAESETIEAYQKPLLDRSELPPALAKTMYTWVSAALRQHIARTFELDVDDLDDAMAANVVDLHDEQVKRQADASPNQQVVRALCESKALDEKLLVHVLERGLVGVFEEAFAALLELDVRRTRRLLYDTGWEKLAIACRAIDISADTFCYIQATTDQSRLLMDEYADHSTDTPRRFYEALNQPDSMGVLRRWRRDPDFTAALEAFSSL